MKRFFTFIIIIGLVAGTAIGASKPTSIIVYNIPKQHITGFGGACCDGAMCPFAKDTKPVELLYGPESKIGLNILRMEISPNFIGDVIVPEWGNWDSPYDWKGSLPSAKIVKQRGGIVFGTPWSPPGEYKTNGTAQGGKVKENDNDPQNKRGKLREDCYEKFFPWLNTYLGWMKDNGVDVDAVSLQNEPDWWVNYSGCLYDPQDLVKLVKNYAYMLDREKYHGVKLISGEPLGFTQNYTDPLMWDETCREQIDIVAGHLYGHLPLQYMKHAGVLPLKYGKELWMTEHSVLDNIDHMPTWYENLIFAEELNECMLAGCTGYIYWYLRAHWSFCGTGQSWTYKINGVDYTASSPDNKKNVLLPRAFVMSHFSKYVTGSTRLETSKDNEGGREKEEVAAPFEYSAYIKDNTIIVMAINTTQNDRKLKIKLPFKVKSGILLQSLGNEEENLCQKEDITIAEPVSEVLVEMPYESLNTYIFTIDQSTAMDEVRQNGEGTKTYFDLQGHRLTNPRGLCIEKSSNGSSKKVFILK